MAVIPNSIASLPLKALRASLAESSTFQAFTGAAGPIPALAFIHYVSTATPAVFPYAVVDVVSGEWTKVATGAFDQLGSLVLILRQAIADSTDAAQPDAAVGFLNSIGGIIDDLLANAFRADCFLNISGISHTQPARPRKEDRPATGDFYESVLTVAYEGAV